MLQRWHQTLTDYNFVSSGPAHFSEYYLVQTVTAIKRDINTAFAGEQVEKYLYRMCIKQPVRKKVYNTSLSYY